ncbi:MAG: endonuclease/exonuclease/phosphatase family protein [Tsuneonella sp.]
MPTRIVRKHPRLAAMLLAAGIVLALAGQPQRPHAAEHVPLPSPLPMLALSALTVMSYNVEGLPPPVRFGRAASLARIADRLSELRRAGRAPNVVLLQEAFTDPDRPIEAIAGYRYAARGPDANEVNASSPTTPAERRYAAGASELKGEGAGKWESSGLRILSDFPIVRTERLAFPEWACAGYDCLANKGVLIAWVAVPGSPQPVAFVDTHLNSGRAADVSLARADEAYAFQSATLRTFVARQIGASAPAFFGGDFNTDTPLRWRELGRDVLPGGRNALLAALAHREVAAESASDALAILKRGKDWLYFRGAQAWPVQLERYWVPFGVDGDGSTLSDHMGYAVDFRVGSQRAS